MQCITHSDHKIDCHVTLPLSKSILNRLLVIAHLSGNRQSLFKEEDASDVATMRRLLLEIENKSLDSNSITELNVGNAGTVMRFLIAVLAITDGKWLITGSERMLQRPIKPLTDVLQKLGASIHVSADGYPPVKIEGNSKLKGGIIELNASISSQFVSALMMIAPFLKGGLIIKLRGNIISGSYIRLTESVMKEAGASVSFTDNEVIVREGEYRTLDFNQVVEHDWVTAD